MQLWNDKSQLSEIDEWLPTTSRVHKRLALAPSGNHTCTPLRDGTVLRIMDDLKDSYGVRSTPLFAPDQERQPPKVGVTYQFVMWLDPRHWVRILRVPRSTHEVGIKHKLLIAGHIPSSLKSRVVCSGEFRMPTPSSLDFNVQSSVWRQIIAPVLTLAVRKHISKFLKTPEGQTFSEASKLTRATILVQQQRAHMQSYMRIVTSLFHRSSAQRSLGKVLRSVRFFPERGHFPGSTVPLERMCQPKHDVPRCARVHRSFQSCVRAIDQRECEESGTPHCPEKTKTYIDNARNRRLKRVGKRY